MVGDRGEATDRGVHTGRSAHRYQLEAVRTHLRGGAPFPLDVGDAVATAELIGATYRSAGFEPRPGSTG